MGIITCAYVERLRQQAREDKLAVENSDFQENHIEKSNRLMRSKHAFSVSCGPRCRGKATGECDE